MAFDTTGLSGWPNPDTIETAAAAVAESGRKLGGGVEECEAQWRRLYPSFSTGDGGAQNKIETLFDTVKAHGSAVEGAASLVESALDGFAADVRAAQALRDAAFLRIAEHTRLADAGEPAEAGMYSTAAVQEFVNGVSAHLVRAAEECAGKLEGIDADAISDIGWLPELSPSDGTTVLAWAEFTSVDYTYSVRTNVEIPVWDYSVTAPSADWIVDADGNITRAPFVSSRERVGTRFEIQDVAHHGTRREWLGVKTPVNPWAYDKLDWYQRRVDANPRSYTTGGPRFWDVQGRLNDFENGMANGSSAGRVLRVAGPIATVATLGLTYKSEYDGALEELATEHPQWSQDQLEDRAREEAAVKGTTQAAMDVGAGAAGAMVGTMIGGPVGTVIGFGVGIGVSWLVNESGLGDAVKDGAQDLWDGASDAAGDAGDAISDAWNSVFG
ncbi:MAG: hypothetical protein ABWX68_01715 [Arthrobacter sp.]|uniref:hypothetical protein n=1 Tax=Arthrobacter sp. TaxID=1667 RepID=UPI00348950DD